MVDHLAGLRDGYVLRFAVVQSSQDVGANNSLINWSLNLLKGNGSGKQMSGAASWSVTIDGQTASGSISGYDFRNYSTLVLREGSFTVPHNSDGTKTIGVSGAWADNPTYGELGNGTTGGNQVLTTIPRATTATYTNPMVAGTAYTIGLPRASSAFTHNIFLYFGGVQGQQVANGAGASVSWTPPMDLLNQMPNAATAAGYFRIHTYNGSTLIGTRDQAISISAPASVVPTFSSITHYDVSPAFNAAGGYVKGISYLGIDINGSVGAYGSTIASAKIEVNGQTINGFGGYMPAVFSVAGTVAIKGTITDSRGRSTSASINVNVMNYAPPSFISASVQRATAAGTVQDVGTYFRINLNAAATALVGSGTQRNALVYKVFTRVRGTSAWTQKTSGSGTGNVFNSFIVVGTYSIQTSYDILIEIGDYFSSSQYQLTIATAAIFMHWDASIGVGIGKFREYGMLDVAGAIYQNNGLPVLDSASGFSIQAAIANGTDMNNLYIPGSYRVGGGSYNNFPPGAYAYGILVVIGSSNTALFTGGDGIQQIFYSDTGAIYTRQRWAAANAWRPWARIYDTEASPYAQASGAGALTVPANTGLSATITLPGGRFAVAPNCTVSFGPDASYYGGGRTASVWSVTTSSLVIGLSNPTAAQQTMRYTWTAIQMTPISANG